MSEDKPFLTSQNDDTGEIQVESNVDHLFPDGPFLVTVKVAITQEPTDEGEFLTGWVDMELQPGTIPTAESLSRMAEAIKADPTVKDQGMRFMTRKEFGQTVLAEHIGVPGMKFAVPQADRDFTLEAFRG